MGSWRLPGGLIINTFREGLGGEGRDTQSSLALGGGWGLSRTFPIIGLKLVIRSIKMLSQRQRLLPRAVLVLLLVCLEVASITGKSSGVPLTLFCPPFPQQKHMSEHLQGVPGIDLSGSYYEVCSPVSTGAFDDATIATWRGMGLRSSSVPWAQV